MFSQDFYRKKYDFGLCVLKGTSPPVPPSAVTDIVVFVVGVIDGVIVGCMCMVTKKLQAFITSKFFYNLL